MATNNNATLHFGKFTLALKPASLSKDGQNVALQSQPLRLLTLLASRNGEIVSQKEIRKHVWGDLQVDFASGIHVCIRQIRRALDDDGDNPQFIETVPRRGYRFVAEVVQHAAPAKPRRNAVTIAGIVVALTLAAAIAYFVTNDGTRLPAVPEEAVATEDGYLRGLELLQAGDEQDAVLARQYFALAIERDPDFAPAYAGMARAHEATRDFEQAWRFADLAIAKDATYAEAYARLASAVSFGDWNWTVAEQNLVKAIALAPAQAHLHRALATNFMVTDRTSAALDTMSTALELDPESNALLVDYGTYLYYTRDFAGAREKCNAAALLDANDIGAQACLYQVARADKQYERAMQHAVSIMTLQNATQNAIAEVQSLPDRSGLERFEIWRLAQLETRAKSAAVSPVSFAWSLAAIGRFDEALYHLIQGSEQHFPDTPAALLDPIFIAIRHQTRYYELAEDMRVNLGPE